MKRYIWTLTALAAWALPLHAEPKETKARSFSDKEVKALIPRGKAVFDENCVACHGVKGDGKGPAATALGKQAKPRNFTSETYRFGEAPPEVFATITDGSPGTAMPPWKSLPEEDRWALAYYVLSLKTKPTH